MLSYDGNSIPWLNDGIYHHLMSKLVWIFMWITEQCFFFASVSNNINQPMKDWPGFTTLHAWFK